MPRSPENRDRQSSVPLPVSVTLYNLLTPTGNQHDSKKKGVFRPEYTADLLVPVHLNVVIASKDTERGNDMLDEDGCDQADDDILVFTASNDRGAIHPSWDHLDERIDLFNASEENDLKPIYQSMRIRIIATPEANAKRLLVDIPLHPSLLRRLPEDTDTAEDEGGISWEQRPPPKELPPNAILIDFSDGSTRVLSSLYHLLLERNVIVEPDPRDASLLQDEDEEHRRMSRFTDDVFDTLDQANWWENDGPEKRRPSPYSLLEMDDESKAVPVKSLGVKSMDLTSSESYAAALGLSNGTSEDHDYDSPTAIMGRKVAGLSLADHDAGKLLPIEQYSAIADKRREKEELELLIAEEEPLLQEEMGTLHEVCFV